MSTLPSLSSFFPGEVYPPAFYPPGYYPFTRAGTRLPFLFEIELVGWASSVLGLAVYPLYRPQQVPLPAVTFQAVDMQTNHNLSGASGLNKVTAQFTSWSYDYFDCLVTIDNLRNALDGYKGPIGRAFCQAALRVKEVPLYNEPRNDSDEGVFQRAAIYDLWYNEPLPAAVP